MKKNTIVKISLFLQCQKIPEGISIKLGNHNFPNWKQQKPTFLKNFGFFFGKCHIVPKESSMLTKPFFRSKKTNYRKVKSHSTEKLL